MSNRDSGGLLLAQHVVRLRHVSHLAVVCEIVHDNVCRGFKSRTSATYRILLSSQGYLLPSKKFCWGVHPIKGVPFTVHSHLHVNIFVKITMEYKSFWIFCNQCNLFMQQKPMLIYICWVSDNFLLYKYCINQL